MPDLNPKSVTDEEANRLLNYYADLDGLTGSDCQKLRYDDYTCRLLQTVLGTHQDAFITPEKQELLYAAGFSESFIRALAGTDGAAALRRRTRWLAENMPKIYYQPYLDLLVGLAPYAQETVPILTKMLANAKPPFNLAIQEVINKIQRTKIRRP